MNKQTTTHCSIDGVRIRRLALEVFTGFPDNPWQQSGVVIVSFQAGERCHCASNEIESVSGRENSPAYPCPMWSNAYIEVYKSAG